MRRIGWIGLILLGLCLGFGYWSSFQVGVNHVTISDAPLSRVFAGKTVVHISDLHIAAIGLREKKVLALLKTVKPDIIFLTGDYIKWKGKVEPALDYLKQIKAPMGVYGVLGDHENSNSRGSCLFCHQKGSKALTRDYDFQMLRNSQVKIAIGENRLTIFGLPSDHFDGEDPASGIHQLPDEDALIVLSHNPLNFDRLENTRKAFLMSGDTHGGQIPLPKILWAALGYEKNRKYNYGLFEDGRKKMFVTRGVGYNHLPLRFFCSPEIVVYHFETEGRKGK